MENHTRMPLLPISTPRTLQACKNLQCKNNTVFIASYPKSGTTWLQNIVFELASNGNIDLDHISNYCPFYEAESIWTFSEEGTPTLEKISEYQQRLGLQIFNTHLLPSMLPMQGKEKYIYIVRNPKDVCTSYYRHLSSQAVEDGGYKGTLDQFVDEWCNGEIAYGTWRNHVSNWETEKSNPALLFLQYEELKKDLKANVTKISEHLGLKRTEEEVQRVVEASSFQRMRANQAKFHPRSVQWRDQSFNFLRKGIVGDSQNLLRAEHHQRITRDLQGFQSKICSVSY